VGGVGVSPGRFSLRTRLIVAVLLILTVGLAVAGVAASALLRGYLAGRVDDEMVSVVGSLQRGMMGQRLGPMRMMRQDLPSRYVVRVLEADGSTLVTLADPITPGPQPDLAGVTTDVAAEHAGTPYTVTAADGTPWRVLLTPLPQGRTFALATSLQDVQATAARLRGTIVVVDLAVLLLGALAALAAVRGSLRPLGRIEETAEAIAGGDLARRVPVEGGPRTEVGRLSRALNGMLTQIEEAFAARTESEHRMRRFLADASHELRTPLTSIRGFAELYRQGAAREPEELDRLMRRIEDEAARMGDLVEDLLLLARLDKRRPLRQDLVDVVVLAADAVHDARAAAPDHVVRLAVATGSGDGEGTGDAGVLVRGDEARLRQVLMNLVVNAVRHTPPGTHVEVRARAADGNAVVEVADDGPGLLAGEGSGLGLTIVTELVRAHGGRLEVDTAPGAGATFRVLLPLAAPELPANPQVAL
jgi:two-component system OmpR family sensor kinase